MNLPAGRKLAIAGQPGVLAGNSQRGASGTVQAAIQQAIDEAYITGYRTVMLICAELALASAVISWVTIGGQAVNQAGSAAEAEQHS